MTGTLIPEKKHTDKLIQFICVLFIQYFAILARFHRGQFLPLVISLSCSLKSLVKILHIYM
ncbi:hypothetical protein MHZ36_04165 [Staphylococcus sp. ACRSN]|nr:hypothetical protein [Staphylococcus sp. ACRSN]MCG7338474.1 hypothetical protein [Staphylococcus sp. ACRSN]